MVPEFADRYADLIRQYVADPAETHLTAIAQLGRELVQAGVPAEEVGELHQIGLDRLSQTEPELKLPEIVEAISTPLLELLISYGLFYREQVVGLEKANDALEISEQRFKDFADSASDWMWETDAENCYSFLSDSFTASTGLSSEERIGRRRWELASSDVDDSIWRDHLGKLENRQPFREFIYKVRGGAGEQLYFRDAGVPIPAPVCRQTSLRRYSIPSSLPRGWPKARVLA